MNPIVVAISVAIFATSVLGQGYGGNDYRRRCPHPGDPDHGYCKVSGYKATYYCNDGYELWDGDNDLYCSGGRWRGKKPRCRKIYDDGDYHGGSCSHPGDPDHGYCKVSGHKATYYCNDGYELYDGDNDLYCYDGSWRGKKPRCRKRYDDGGYHGGSCSHPGDPDHGYCKVSGHKATYYCNDGYELYDGDNDIYCYDGSWRGKKPRCRKHSYVKYCKYLSDPDYGYVKSDGNEVGCTASYYCHDGYELYGNRKRKCQYSGYWSGSKPICKPKRCPRVRYIPYGKVRYSKYSHGGYGYEHGTYAIYDCDYGYSLYGNRKRVCRKGYWYGRIPRCVKKKRYY